MWRLQLMNRPPQMVLANRLARNYLAIVNCRETRQSNQRRSDELRSDTFLRDGDR
jgi:hypothetical protein